MSLAERLKKVIDEEGSQKAFCEKTGIKQTAVSRIVNSDSGLRSQTLEQIAAAYPTLNLRWLLMGDGPQWIDAEATAADVPAADLTREKDPTLDRLNQLLEQRLAVLEKVLKEENPDLAREYGIE